MVTLEDIRGHRGSGFRVASSALAGEHGATGSLPTRIRNIEDSSPINGTIAVEDAIINRRISSESGYPWPYVGTVAVTRRFAATVNDCLGTSSNLRFGYLAVVQQVSEGFLRAVRGRVTVVTRKRQRVTASWGDLLINVDRSQKNGTNSLSSIYLAARTCPSMRSGRPL